jgi:hypothetical protein
MSVTTTSLRRRISRSIVTILAISSLAVVVPPVLAPQVSTPTAEAADANPFPSIAGMVRYVAESYTAGSNTWPSTAGTNAVTVSGTTMSRVTTTAGTFGASKAVPAVRGFETTTLTWPATILSTSAYTFITVARYAPSSTTYSTSPSCTNTATHTVNNADKRNRIFSSVTGNWLHGFWACASGVNHRDGWFTPQTSSIIETSGNKVDNWVLGAECGFVSGGSADCNGQYRAFGVNRTTGTVNYSRGYQVVINGGAFPGEVSDFQIAEVIAYPTILSLANVIRLETYLARQYGITLSASAATKLAVYTPSVGSNLGQQFTTQPQIVVQDANNQTVTTDNSTIITATITGAGGALIGTRTADVVQGIATFENLGVTGTTGTSYTITYTSSPALTSTSEVRTFTRGPRTATLAVSKTVLAMDETAVATISTSPSSNNDGTITYSATGNACSVGSATGIVTATRPDGVCSISATIASGSSYDAATTSAIPISIMSASPLDYAVSLDGTNDYLTRTDHSSFDLSGNFTIQAWVKPDVVTGTQMIVNKENSYMIFIINGFFGIAADSSGNSWAYTPSTVPAIAGEWHHVAYVRVAGQSNYTLYLDGVAVYTGPADNIGANNLSNTADAFSIGRRSSRNDQRFNGMIDQVAGFTTARTAEQIRSDMHGHISADTAGLSYYYDFNAPSTTWVYNLDDSGITGNDVVPFGTVDFVDIKEIDTSAQPAYTQVKFPRSYITAMGGWQSPNSLISFTSLVVAGGGAGGARISSGAGGGGGAGGMVETNLRTLDTSSVITIRVGQGGLGFRTGTDTTLAPGGNGENSILTMGATSFTAIGGGGGAGGEISDTNSYRGLAGGSGGGASGSNVSGYSGGAAQQQSGSGFTGYGNAGGMNPGCSGTRPAGGGGGAGSAGVTPQTCSPAASGAGGSGRTSTVTGAIYAGGGGGGLSGDNGVTAGTGGSGGGANGSGGILITGSSDYLGIAGTANTGGGGGGVGRASPATVRGGSGGSGIIVIKYLTTARPVFTGPTSDTTTAGLTHTFTVVGNAPSPLVRSYLWQSSTDTGSTWVAISIGTGLATANYTTPILETNTSGSRFQYRVVVTDTDTAGTFLVETSTGVSLIINLQISISGSYTPAKYGTSRTDTFTVAANSGTGTKTIRRTSPARNFVTWDTSTVNTARVTVAPQLTAGVYYDTLTVTDQESATLIHVVMITVLKADTVTITVANRNDTYTASSLSYIDTFTITGLVAGDSLTGVSYTYSGSANDGTVYTNSARPALAGQYSISPVYTLVNASSYESVTVTSGTLTINRKLRSLAVSTSPATLKYGDTSTVVATTVDGASDGLMSYTSSTTSLCQFSGPVLQALEATGNCQYTATIGRGNNFDTATTTSATTTLALADTLTVTVLPITALTFTGSQAVVSPRISVSGFKLTDTTTATSASFSYRIAGTTDSFTATAPTFSDTYTVRAETLTVTVGQLSRYRAITYVDGTLGINRAQQAPLVLPQFSSVFGTPYRVIVYGGSGTGDVTESVTAGTATGCLVVGDTVTTTTEGSCFLTVTKAQDRNYETATVSAFIYFITWVAPAAPTVGTGPTIALNGENTVIIDERRAPVITSFGDSGNASYPVAIYGAGFLSATAGVTEVKFWRDKSLNSSDFLIVSDSLIWSRQASGATKGKIYVINENGMAISPTSYTPFVVVSI